MSNNVTFLTEQKNRACPAAPCAIRLRLPKPSAEAPAKALAARGREASAKQGWQTGPVFPACNRWSICPFFPDKFTTLYCR